MLHVKDSICVAGAQPCEDAIGYGENFIFALDGASCLTGINFVHPKSDAHWFASEVCSGLKTELAKNDSRTIEDILRFIIDPLREEYLKGVKEKGLDIPDDSPSAGIALFRIVDGFAEFYGLGDCVGVCRLKDGRVLCQNDTALSSLDAVVIGKMAQIHKDTGMPVTEARKLCTDLLVRHRGLKNKEGGYFILDPFAAGIDHAVKFRVPVAEVESLSVFSDGFSQSYEVFGMYSNCEELHKDMSRKTLKEICDELFMLQDKDPLCNQHPRFKLRDDTCAVYAVTE